MREITPSPLNSQHSFTSFEIFSNVLNGYALDVKQIERGSFTGFLQQMQCGTVALNRFSSSRRVEANGTPPPGVWTFGIPTASCQPFVWRGRPSSGSTIQIYNPSTELAIITHPQFEAIDISISEKDFNILNHQWGFPDLDKLIGKDEMLSCSPATMFRLRMTLGYICELFKNKPACFSQEIELQKLVNYQVPYLLAQALLTSETHTVKKTDGNRSRALKTVIDHIHSISDPTVTIEAICSDTGINKRTLQRAFLDQYGVTPKSYVQALRLNDAYKALLHGDPDTTRVTDIAIAQGYWHMSQFAADYHRQFGELPSETIKKSHIG